MSVEAYPLQWPQREKRTESPSDSRFRVSLIQARDGLMNELRKMDATEIVLSSNLKLGKRGDLAGLPVTGQPEPRDPGVAVYFLWQGEAYTLCCDQWNRVADNIQAIRKTVEAMRGLDRWGVSNMLKRAFTGFKALPEPIAKSGWWEVLGVSQDASIETVERSYKEQMKRFHPDFARDEADRKFRHEISSRLNLALSEARDQRRG